MMRIDRDIRRLATGLMAPALLLAASCASEDPAAPPNVHLGDDVCAVCHMIVSDERYAAALSVRDERGRVEKPLFDDIGCLFEHEASAPDQEILARHVRHADAGVWIDADAAVYLQSRELHTPMGFGIGALATRAEAESLRERYPGDVIDIEEARRRVLSGEAMAGAGYFGGSQTETGDDGEAVIELEDGRALRLALRTPRDIALGRRPFEIEIHQRGVGGAWRPVGGVDVRIEPWMPSMGHGSPGNEHPTRVEGALHRGVVNFSMPGDWVVHVTLLEGGQELARRSFEFDVRRASPGGSD
ncbi:MAG: hypothetical protein EA376_13715 [Phycisphaeraceae bacterium]|nr:MAG: hypothetical protein EA376_13715 [Phycisphaeraceae bacterium]